MKQITTQQGQDLGRKIELLRNAATLTKSSTGTLFVYLALLVCYLPNACILEMYPILEQNTTIKTMQLYTLTLLLFESSHLLLEDETHSACCYGHITKYNEKS